MTRVAFGSFLRLSKPVLFLRRLVSSPEEDGPPVDEPETDRGSPGSGDSQNWSSRGPLKKLAFQKMPRAPLWMIVQSGTLKYLMTRHPVESLWSRNASLLSRIE